MKKLKIGVIGAGHLGKIHIKLLKEIETADLSAIYDKDKETAEKAGAEIGVKVAPDLDSFFKEVDAVSVVSATSAHYELVKKCFDHNKHVFVEKPITAKVEEAEELVKISKEKKLKLQVGHIERFNPALLSVEKFNLDPKFIQTDRLAQFNPRGTDVAVVLDLMIHDIDIILSLVKSEVKNISASGVAVVSGSIDIANARLEFENGAVANVTASRISQKKMRKMRIFQRDAYISLDFNTGVSEVFRLAPPEEITGSHFSFGEIGVGANKKAIVYEHPEVKEVNALKYELELFTKTVLEDKQPVVSGEDGLKALKVAQEIITIIENNKII
jgi:predicted dehydrogenase